VQKLLTIRRLEIVPRLAGIGGGSAKIEKRLSDPPTADDREALIDMYWSLNDGSRLRLIANLRKSPVEARISASANPETAGCASDGKTRAREEAIAESEPRRGTRVLWQGLSDGQKAAPISSAPTLRQQVASRSSTSAVVRLAGWAVHWQLEEA